MNVLRTSTVFAILASLIAPAAASAAVEDQLIVRYKSGTDSSERADARQGADVVLERRMLLSRTELLDAGSASGAAQAVAELQANPDVAWVQRDRTVTADSINDPRFPEQLSLADRRVSLSPSYSSPINLLDGWANGASLVSGGVGGGQTIAVVDSGIDFTHPDLVNQFATNPGETGTDSLDRDKKSNGVDDDGNGLVDDWRGFDFVAGDNNASDEYGHRTHVAGIIAAQADNGLGITGVAPQSKRPRLL